MSDFKTLILLKSVHRQNTRKVADAMIDVIHGDVFEPNEVTPDQLDKYDLIGFGSGVYFCLFHSELRKWIRQMKPLPERRPAFVFSTSGLAWLSPVWHAIFKRRLAGRGLDVLGEFGCRGHDLVGPLRLIGGLNRNHPNEADLEAAAQFAASIKMKAIEARSGRDEERRYAR